LINAVISKIKLESTFCGQFEFIIWIVGLFELNSKTKKLRVAKIKWNRRNEIVLTIFYYKLYEELIIHLNNPVTLEKEKIIKGQTW
jgi:hypothetical protein